MAQIDHQSVQPHGLIARVIHWAFIAFFIYAILKGLDDVSQLADPGLLRFEMLFAAAFLLILAARFFYMKFTRPTALPDDTSPFMRKAARLGHLALYASLAMIAISGLLIGTLYAIGLTSGFVIDAAVGLHVLSIILSYAMIALHISAAIYHRLLGDGIWSSMVPFFKE